MEKAIALYHGDFLPGDSDELWSLALRERLRSRFLRAVETLAQYHEAAEKFNKAVNCLRRGIEVDPVAENLYQRHIRPLFLGE